MISYLVLTTLLLSVSGFEMQSNLLTPHQTQRDPPQVLFSTPPPRPSKPSASSWAGVRLQKKFQRAVEKKMSWGAPTPVQSSTIPAICNEKDVWVEAPTGSGKTAAFALPILQHLSYAIDTSLMESRGRRYVDALVLSPTRELAIQTKHVFTALHEASTPSLTGDESEVRLSKERRATGTKR